MAATQTTSVPQPPPRTTSFQRMLELEKKYKLERLHTTPLPSPTTSPTTESFNIHSSATSRHADSLSQYQNDLMLKAVRRNVTLPSLSLAIPAQNGDRGSDGLREPEEKEGEEEGEEEPREGEQRGNGVSSEASDLQPLHKSVKFLAPDSDSDDNSDQSSICQSPSWEGYGQKKKDKKKEAEKKRKEKERAEREARASRKKPTTRLIKAPPVSMRQLPTLMERSNSAPVLDSHRDAPPSRGHHLHAVYDDEPESGERPIRTPRSMTPDLRDLTGPRSSRHPVGLRREHAADVSWLDIRTQGGGEEAPSHHTAQPQSPVFPDRGMSYSPVSMFSMNSTRFEPKSHRDSRPPSASRTPQLRHTAGDRQLGRSHSLLQSGQRPPGSRDGNSRPPTTFSSARSSMESAHAPGSRAGRPRPFNQGYVKHQRDQSTERAMAVLADENLSSSISIMSQSIERRSSSQHSRRQSLTLGPESTTAAAKSTGYSKGTSDGKYGPAGEQGDYFSFQHPADARPSTMEGQVVSTKNRAIGPQMVPVTDLVAMQNHSTPSIRSGTTSPGPGRIRSLKDVAKAAFKPAAQTSSSQAPTPAATPTPAKAPPYLILRSRIAPSAPKPAASTPAGQTGTVTTPAPADSSQATKATAESKATTATTSSSTNNNNNNSTTRNPQPDSRVSEGSSSSSNYDDVSPLPSPATTPDTSRPHSAKGLPALGAELSKGDLDHLAVSDDQKTLRPSTEGARVPDSPGRTPRRTVDAEDMASEAMTEEDRWSRTAMPMEIDLDARSIMSDDDVDGQGTTTATNVTASEQGQQPNTTSLIHLPKSLSNPNLIERISELTPLGRSGHQPSSARQRPAVGDGASGRPQTSPVGNQVRDGEKKSAQRPPNKLRKHKPEPEPKSASKETVNTTQVVVQGEGTSSDSTVSKPNSENASSASTSPQSSKFISPIGVASSGLENHTFFVDFSDVGKVDSDPAAAARTQIQDGAGVQSASSPPATAEPIIGTASSLDFASEDNRTPPEPLKSSATRSAPSPTPSSTSFSFPERRVTSPPRSTSTPALSFKATSPPQPPSSPPLNSSGPLARSHVLSAIPKHLQPPSTRSLAASPEGRLAPVAKMFVECCGCRFFHDMPSKLYECMAKPDAVVEDQTVGISGAITTMVKCPWCQHNMTTRCCAGYAAVVYVKEKLH